MEEQPLSQLTPNQSTPTPPVPVKQTNKALIVTALLVFLLMTGGLVYLGYQNWQLQQRLNQLLEQQADQAQPTLSPTVPPSSPTPDQTTNWQTYTSEVLGITVGYPDTWYLTKCGPGEAALLNPNTRPQCAGEPYEPIHFFADNKIQSESEFIASLGTEFKLTPRSDLLDISVEHQKYLVEKIQPAPGPDSFIEIRVPLSNGSLKIYVFDTQYEEIADQILSTFKSLN